MPSTGVADVVLRVALVRPDSATTLRVWPAGAPLPTAAATAEITVPVGTNGMVSLQHSAGMSQITVDVVGYHASPGP